MSAARSAHDSSLRRDDVSSIGILLRALASTTPDPVIRSALDTASRMLSDHTDGPFLTVLLRTQGKRDETLQDALLCLAGQTDHDFEVLVLAHDATEPDTERVRRRISEQTPSLRERICLIEVSGGNRGTPLNVGIGAARGQYLAIFDDDDLLLAHWVAQFRRASHRASGPLIRSVAATQGIERALWRNATAGISSTTGVAAYGTHDFDLLDHMRINSSPLMTFAFPRYIFTKLGIRFDDDLAVCEDWDVVIRSSLLCGVTTIPEITTIYRRWASASNSSTAHSDAEWRESEAQVRDKLNESALLFPPGSADEFIRALGTPGTYAELQDLLASRSWRWTSPLRRVRTIRPRLIELKQRSSAIMSPTRILSVVRANMANTQRGNQQNSEQ